MTRKPPSAITPITGSMLYDMIQCEHRPYMDVFANPALRESPDPFVELLWEAGQTHEEDVIASLGLSFVSAASYDLAERESQTRAAINAKASLIYGGRISSGDLLGEPDLLRWDGSGYVAGDIKSGAGLDKTGYLKKDYGVQVALYTDILEQLGIASTRTPFILDVDGNEVPYDLDALQGKRSPWSIWREYTKIARSARDVISGTSSTLPAYSSKCKQCHWQNACINTLESSDDLTLLSGLGRQQRNKLIDHFPDIPSLANANVGSYIAGSKTTIPGIGSTVLTKLHERAKHIMTPGAQPYKTGPIILPSEPIELFFDIEFDTMRDFCYLHGFVERCGGISGKEQFISFFADEVDPKNEKQVFRDAYTFMTSRSGCSIFYYTSYEWTMYRKLQAKYPGVCSASDIDRLFEQPQTVDLYTDIVSKLTEWPTRDRSIKTLAKFLGFKWRDTNPSGAASIRWFDDWVSTSDLNIKQRILEYNEDDCIATRVVFDHLRNL
jgi:predicted RecB family nuclease